MRKLTPLPLIVFMASLVLMACASIGSPDGGAYDETPPKVEKCQPANQSTGNTKRKISIYFDEYINLENATEKVVVSPPQMEMPDIRTAGKKINITLHDTLIPNTTYTVDFSDAIVDNNEGNPMGNFTYSFSTGSQIDTLEVSGTVLEAENLEPIKGILVGLHANLDDSAFTTTPFNRVSRTNGSGRFTIKGVAPGSYRIYALQDADANFLFNQKSEKLAFDTIVISPSCAPDLRYDTLWIDSTHIDTVKPVPYTHFYPDNIVMRAFTEAYQDLHLVKTERPIPDKFTLYFTCPSDTLPHITPLNFDDTSSLILEKSLGNDTLTYWITDTLVSNADTLTFALTYLETDTLGQLMPRTDTLDLVPKITRSQQNKDLQEKTEQWEKEQKKERKRKKEKYVERPNPFLRQDLGFSIKPNGKLSPDNNLHIQFDEPVASIDSLTMHFYKKVDTLWVEEPYLFLPDENSLRSYTLYAEWRPGIQYKLETDSNTVTSILGKQTAVMKKEITVATDDDFGALFIRLIMPDTGAVVQLVNGSDKIVRSVRATNNRADFFYLPPEEYYVRLFIDRNGDGKWNTGCYAEGLQAEEVFYFPKPLKLRARWEIEQDWEVRGIPLEKQKAEAITKQKPDAEKKIKQRNAERNKNK